MEDDSYDKQLVQLDAMRSREDDNDNDTGAFNTMYTNVQRRTHVREIMDADDDFEDTDTDTPNTSRRTKMSGSESRSVDSALFSEEEMDLTDGSADDVRLVCRKLSHCLCYCLISARNVLT